MWSLLDRGANVDAGDENKQTVLVITCEKGLEATARALLDGGAKVDALKNGLNIDSAKMLAKIGAEKGIMLSGACNATVTSFYWQSLRPDLRPADAILIGSDLQFRETSGRDAVKDRSGYFNCICRLFAKRYRPQSCPRFHLSHSVVSWGHILHVALSACKWQNLPTSLRAVSLHC